MSQILAIIFDFDDTLAPDSTTSFLQEKGIDIEVFWNYRVKTMIEQGWDPVPGYLYAMIEASREIGQPIKREELVAHGENIAFHQGVETIFTRLQDYMKKQFPSLVLEFYLISSGISDILENTAIASNFSEIWSSAFHFDHNDEAIFCKKVVSFTDKTRYIFQIEKGIIGEALRNKPFEVNRKVEPAKLRVPLDQMIVVGDGMTDVPCFSLIRQSKGVALAVYNRHNKRTRPWGFIEDGRVSNLVPADYSEDSALADSLLMAIDSIARKKLLDQHSYIG